MSKSSWIIFVVVVFALFGGLIIWTKSSNPSIDTSAIDTSSVLVASEASGGIADHVKGNKDSKVVIVEYGDFQCGGCAGASNQVYSLMDSEYGEKIAFVYRNFPLPGHPNARAAAGAAEAAGLQGKYWEMHESLFSNQNAWSSLDSKKRLEAFVNYAEQLELDIDKFNKDFASTEVNRKISFDRSLGQKDNVNATPTFFLNGKKLDNETSSAFSNGDHEPLKKLIDEALK